MSTDTLWYCPECEAGVDRTKDNNCPKCKKPLEDIGFISTKDK